MSVTEKWKTIEPYWEKSSNTACNKVVLLSIKELFGIDRLDANSVEELSARIREAYKPNTFS
ncbi:hypothetical protein OU798_03810 [Prolixibacteraceae bacterium Z1-6]|uniref:Uncharacterized protein n=1 Tax=Draconibacterium aestuarii TaxID=2998507 RepID=A0A9X3F2P2_9BACT|nr:hypothetical protein [Prolixibacteraceae bacterium Z1-6]